MNPGDFVTSGSSSLYSRWYLYYLYKEYLEHLDRKCLKYLYLDNQEYMTLM